MYFAYLHDWVDLAGYENDNFNNSLLFIYTLAGFTLVSNFRFFLLVTTPLAIVVMAINLSLQAHLPKIIAGCECAAKFDVLAEFFGLLRVLLPIWLGIYLQHKSLA